MMAIVGVLKETRVFSWAVARLLQRSGTRPAALIVLLAWFTGILSAFADNVTTVIFVTPMATGMAKQLSLRPVVILLPMVMASNIGGTATLIGDPPNIMIGSGAGLSFLAFIMNLTVPVVLMMFVLEWFARRYYRQDIDAAHGAAVALADPPPIVNPRLLRWTLAITVLHGLPPLLLWTMLIAASLSVGAASASASIVAALAEVQTGRAQAKPQSSEGATYAVKIDKRETRLDWTRAAEELERTVRALRPAPGAFALLEGEAVKIWRARVVGRVDARQLDAGRLESGGGQDPPRPLVLAARRPFGRKRGGAPVPAHRTRHGDVRFQAEKVGGNVVRRKGQGALEGAFPGIPGAGARADVHGGTGHVGHRGPGPTARVRWCLLRSAVGRHGGAGNEDGHQVPDESQWVPRG